MKLWILDSSLFFKLVEGNDPSMKLPLQVFMSDATAAGARLGISSVTAQEFLVRPRKMGDGDWQVARQSLDAFEVLAYDRLAAEEAAKIEIAKNPHYYEGRTNTEAKKIWFRDAAIIGTALARGAAQLCTHDFLMSRTKVIGLTIRLVR